jgi:hypothetical protein
LLIFWSLDITVHLNVYIFIIHLNNRVSGREKSEMFDWEGGLLAAPAATFSSEWIQKSLPEEKNVKLQLNTAHTCMNNYENDVTIFVFGSEPYLNSVSFMM